MLKNRLIPCVILKGDVVVQSFGFSKYLPIGRIDAAIEFFVNWDVDEILIIDITASSEGRSFNSEIIRKAVSKCFVPITIGGGISKMQDIEMALDSGADKVSINQAAFENPEFITQASKKYGSQCITVSVDSSLVDNDHYVFVKNGKVNTGKTVKEYCKRMEELGAGEIFLNSIDRDGSRKGYDIELLTKVCPTLNIPVIACGGVGKYSHLSQGILEGGAQAVSAANIFQHTELSTIAAKARLKELNLNIRLCSDVKYSNIQFDHLDRPL